MIVLELLRRKIPGIPVLFLDTGYHFAKTYEFRDRMVNEWSLNLVNLQAAQSVASQEAQFGILNRSDPAACWRVEKGGAADKRLGAVPGVVHRAAARAIADARKPEK